MNHIPSTRPFVLGLAFIAAASLVVAGCHDQPAHPDEKTAVTTTLNNNSLSNVSVSQDRDKGVLTLKGDVDSDSLKVQAETIARQAAPDYTIANEIGVRPAGVMEAGAIASNLDTAIEHNFKASLKAHRNLDDQSISYSAKNGTLVLKGSVKTDKQKQEAADLAKHVPNVQQVVNEIDVKPGKNSTPSS